MSFFNFLFLFLFVFVFSTGCSFFKASKKSPPTAGMEEEEYNEEGASSSETDLSDEEDVVYVDEEDELEEGQEMVEEESGEDDWSDPGAEEDTQLGFEDSPEGGFSPSSEEESFPSAVAGDLGSSEGGSTSPARSEKKWIPLKKIKSTPYQKAGVWVNAVYIVREGETLQSISNKIFNSDRVSHLQALNSHLKNRGVKVGDKIYYNSPGRPDDSQQLLFYFVDQGFSPAEHLVEAGKNIRQVSEELLGHPNSWKEIWATNPQLESKGVLDHSVSVRYFPPGSASAAAQPPPSEEPQALEPVDTSAVEEEAPPLNEEMEPPSQEEESMAIGAEEAPAPLPPGESEDIPPALGEVSGPPSSPQEPSDSSPAEAVSASSSSFLDRDRLIFLGIMGVALILFGIALWKRKRKKEYDFASANIEID